MKNIKGMDLHGTDLHGTDLHDANLRGADLYGTYLRNANLRGADLRKANLRGADLCDADLRDADLCDADLRGADLRDADLRGADLCGADLRGADLRGADLRDADLRGAENIPYIPYACPDHGSFIAYKKANGYIVQIEVLNDARRCSATTNKCRCDKAKVISIQNIDGSTAEISEIASQYDYTFIYKVGEVVEVKDFDCDRWNECSTGIHFFMNRQDAVDY